jgi:hypothetical protein
MTGPRQERSPAPSGSAPTGSRRPPCAIGLFRSITFPEQQHCFQTNPDACVSSLKQIDVHSGTRPASDSDRAKMQEDAPIQPRGRGPSPAPRQFHGRFNPSGYRRRAYRPDHDTWSPAARPGASSRPRASASAANHSDRLAMRAVHRVYGGFAVSLIHLYLPAIRAACRSTCAIPRCHCGRGR